MAGDPRPKTPQTKKKRQSKVEFPADVKERVRRRSGGRCEVRVGDCWGVATMFHHIKRRKEPDNSEGNALHVCAPCHAWVHGHVAESEARGWLARSGS
jgi:hypothetical protein